MFVRDLVGENHGVSFGHDDVFCPSAIAVVADHRSPYAELLVAAGAVPAVPAGDKVMERDAGAGPDHRDLASNGFNVSGDLVAQCQRQRRSGGTSAAIVRVGVANACGANLDENVARAGAGLRHLSNFDCTSGLNQLCCAHCSLHDA